MPAARGGEQRDAGMARGKTGGKIVERLTVWNGRDQNGPRAELADRASPYHAAIQTALRKLARYEDTGLEPDEIDRVKQREIEVGIFDREEIHYNCTVQVLNNSVTGEVSVGWWENKEEETK